MHTFVHLQTYVYIASHSLSLSLSVAHTHTYTQILADRHFSLVKWVCFRQAGSLQQSSGVRGAICQWKTISGEWSVPLVLMSTAGSLCSQQQHAKVIRGWKRHTTNSDSLTQMQKHTQSQTQTSWFLSAKMHTLHWKPVSGGLYHMKKGSCIQSAPMAWDYT